MRGPYRASPNWMGGMWHERYEPDTQINVGTFSETPVEVTGVIYGPDGKPIAQMQTSRKVAFGFQRPQKDENGAQS